MLTGIFQFCVTVCVCVWVHPSFSLLCHGTFLSGCALTMPSPPCQGWTKLTSQTHTHTQKLAHIATKMLKKKKKLRTQTCAKTHLILTSYQTSEMSYWKVSDFNSIQPINNKPQSPFIRDLQYSGTKKKQGQAGSAWVYCSEGNKGPLLSRTAYLSYHRVVVYLEIVLRRSLLYKDLQRNITSINIFFKKKKKNCLSWYTQPWFWATCGPLKVMEK